MRWFLSFGGEDKGPFEATELADFVAAGHIRPGTFMRREDAEAWMPFQIEAVSAAEVQELQSLAHPKARPAVPVWLWGGGAVVVVLAAMCAATGTKKTDEKPAFLPPTQWVPAGPAPVPTPEAAPDPCDADALWDRITDGDGDLSSKKAAMLTTVSKWEPACRLSAVRALCSTGCSDFVSGMVIEAESDKQLRARLTKVRLDANSASLQAAQGTYDKVAAFSRYAKSIISSPRTEAYLPANPTYEDRIAALANGDPCLDRMRNDFRKIDALLSEVEKTLPLAPPPMMLLRGALANLRDCVNCANDRSGCKRADEDLKMSRETIAKIQLLVRVDAKVAGK